MQSFEDDIQDVLHASSNGRQAASFGVDASVYLIASLHGTLHPSIVKSKWPRVPEPPKHLDLRFG